MFKKLTGWLKAREEWKSKKEFRDKISEARKEHAKWQAHFDRLKYDAKPVRGYIADIKYINIDELAKNHYAADVVDMVFWIRFNFEDGTEETVQYFQKPGHTNCDNERRMLEFSGHPSILEYGAIGSYVLGYFKDGKLVALENMPPRTPSLSSLDQPQPA